MRLKKLENSIVAVVRRGKKQCRVRLTDGSTVLVPTTEVPKTEEGAKPNLGLAIDPAKIVKVLRKRAKNSRVLFVDGTQAVIPTDQIPVLLNRPELKAYGHSSVVELPKQIQYTQKDLTKAIIEYNKDSSRKNYEFMFKVFIGAYDRRIENSIKRMSYGAPAQKVEELKSAVYERIIEKQVLQKYNPPSDDTTVKSSSFSTYLFYVINTVVRNDHQKFLKDPVNNGLELGDYCHDDDCGSHADFLDTFVSKAAQKDYIQLEESALFDEFEEYLREFGSWGPILYDEESREYLQKSHRGIFKMMREGYKIKEIAHKLGVTNGSASAYRKDVMQKLDEYLDLRGIKKTDFLAAYDELNLEMD